MPLDQRNKAINAVESWMVRRALSRATAKDVNRLVLDLLRALDSNGPEVAGDTVEGLLAAQRAESRYWPSDDALHRALDDEPLYRNLTRPRLRMLLEALENSLRGSLGEGQPCPRNLTVEHIMPQAWREHWSTDVYDESTGLRRDRLVHSLGNLTLVNGKLNPTLSNRPWIDSETTANEPGNKGKRDYLLRHSELKLNATVVAEHETLWNEQVIHDRGVKLVEQIAAIWPRPATAAHLDATLSPQPVGPFPVWWTQGECRPGFRETQQWVRHAADLPRSTRLRR